MPPDPLPSPATASAPRAERRPTTVEHHGLTLEDPYAWLADRRRPGASPRTWRRRTRGRRRSPNGWDRSVTTCTRRSSARTLETDTSVPFREGDWWYDSRTEEGKDYRIHCRRPDDGSGTVGRTGDAEQVVLDENVVAAGHDYLSVGVLDVSPRRPLARLGGRPRRRRDARPPVPGPRTGRRRRRGRSPTSPTASPGRPTRRTCWYTVVDDAERPVDRPAPRRRHRRPTTTSRCTARPTSGSTSPSASSRSGRRRRHRRGQRDHQREPACSTPTGPTRSAGRRRRARAGRRVLRRPPPDRPATSRRNHGGAEDFAVWRAPLDGTTVGTAGRLGARHRPPARRRASTASTTLRRTTSSCTSAPTASPACGCSTPPPARPAARLRRSGRHGRPRRRTPCSTPSDLPVRLPVAHHAAVGVRRGPGHRRAHPPQAPPGARRLRPGGLHVGAASGPTADDGTLVPISLVWRPDRRPGRRPGPVPALRLRRLRDRAWTRGSRSFRLSLLDRGVVFAHRPRPRRRRARSPLVRGRQVRRQGATRSPTSSPAPGTSSATGRTAPDRLAARGGSAGGLLMGGVANLAPELFRVDRRRGAVRRPARTRCSTRRCPSP